ncbi:MAG: PAS domain S-box protein [Planctomycetia bacterium]|nr:PAS domain S-box protein [Planctomycetia bacterium]
MHNAIRYLITLLLFIPVAVTGLLFLQGNDELQNTLLITYTTSCISIVVWLIYSSRMVKLERHAKTIINAIQSGKENDQAIVEPLQQSAVPFDPIYQALLVVSQKLSERRRQMRDNLDKVGAILVAITHGRPINSDMYEFDLPDADDKTLLLGSLSQMVSTYHHTKHRGDVFAHVLRESPIAMLITDEQYQIKTMNPAAEKLFGSSSQNSAMQNLKDYFVPPPIKNHQQHLKKIVLDGEEALQALQQGKHEVFTTIRTRNGQLHLIGLRASFGQKCLFVIRERSKDKSHSFHDSSLLSVTVESSQAI